MYVWDNNQSFECVMHENNSKLNSTSVYLYHGYINFLYLFLIIQMITTLPFHSLVKFFLLIVRVGHAISPLRDADGSFF